jgi:RNA polymerase sigma-70 factor (ECF subfamily)
VDELDPYSVDPSRDDELAARARRGDPRSLAVLYRRHAPALLDYLSRIFGERADAEDVLQESFLRLFQGRGSYQGRGRFRAWLFTVATHLARDRLQQTRRRGELVNGAADSLRPSVPPDPLEDVARRELVRRVDSALADLPASYSMAVHLRLRESFSYREIAAMTGEPEGTLRSRVHHALKRLRVALAPSEERDASQHRNEDVP